MKTFRLEPQDCYFRQGIAYHAPLIFYEPTNLVILDIYALMIIGSKFYGVAIDTYGGDLQDGGRFCVRGSHLNTGGGCIFTRGGNVCTYGGNIDTKGGDIDTGGGNLDTWGGSLTTNGGKINHYILPDIKIQHARLVGVYESILTHPDKLDMCVDHADKNWMDKPACNTVHGLAGWLQAQSDDEIIRKMPTALAGAILAPCAVKHFEDSKGETMKWLKDLPTSEE